MWVSPALSSLDTVGTSTSSGMLSSPTCDLSSLCKTSAYATRSRCILELDCSLHTQPHTPKFCNFFFPQGGTTTFIWTKWLTEGINLVCPLVIGFVGRRGGVRLSRVFLPLSLLFVFVVEPRPQLLVLGLTWFALDCSFSLLVSWKPVASSFVEGGRMFQ